MHDDDWALFDVDALDDESEDVEDYPLQQLAVGYARPVLLDPRLFNPYRPVTDGPSVDAWPATHTEGTDR